jgi:hypothetical protein
VTYRPIWHPQSWSLSPSRTPRASKNCHSHSHSINVFSRTHSCGNVRWLPFHDRPCCSKRFNPSQYCVTIRDVSMALHIKLCTETALNCNYGLCFNITFDAPRSTAPWLLKLHNLSCLLARGGNSHPSPCGVLAGQKTYVSSAAPLYKNITDCLEIHSYRLHSVIPWSV